MMCLPNWFDMKSLPTFQTVDLQTLPTRIASRPILIYFEFRGKPSLTVICMDPHLPNKLIVTKLKYCFLILGDDTSSFFFLFRFYVMLFILIL